MASDTSYTSEGYDNLLQRSGDSSLAYQLGGNVSSGSGNASDTSSSSATTPTDSNPSAGSDNGNVQQTSVKSSGALTDVWISTFIKSTNYLPKSQGFMIDGARGHIEAIDMYLSGEIDALSGHIGGFTIESNMLYGGTIQTSAAVGAGSNGVIMDSAGLRGYSATLGQVFNLPTDGSAPTFASGIINSTIFNINTNAVLQTSTTVGDGSAASAGILINNTGLYGCAANQLLTNANLKALINGTISITGAINATSGKFGTATNYWSVGATGLTATATSTDVILNYGKTDFGQDTTDGFILGYDFSVSKSKFELGSTSTKLFKYDGTDLLMVGGTITSGLLRTATTGRRVEISGSTGYIDFYNSDNSERGFIGGSGYFIYLSQGALGNAFPLISLTTADTGMIMQLTNTNAGTSGPLTTIHSNSTGGQCLDLGNTGAYITLSVLGNSTGSNLPTLYLRNSTDAYAGYVAYIEGISTFVGSVDFSTNCKIKLPVGTNLY